MRLGVAEIDGDHQALLGLFARLCNARLATINSEVAGELLCQLGQAIFDHFTREELVMSRLPIPEELLRSHVADHTRIVEEYVALQQRVMVSPDTPIGSIVGVVGGWVVAHIEEHDLRIRDYLPSPQGEAGDGEPSGQAAVEEDAHCEVA